MKYKIGQYYDIPCAVFNENGKHMVVPVINHIHSDEKSGQDYLHYHSDNRFVSNKHVNSPSRYIPTRINLVEDIEFIGIRVRRRRFYREDQTAITNSTLVLGNMKKTACITNGKCPHTGYDLSEIESVNGIIKCPLHGLTFDSKTKRLITSKIT